VILAMLEEAVASGARLSAACDLAGLSARTVQRWKQRPEGDDLRKGPCARPGNALTAEETAQVLAVMTSVRYAALSPKQLVPVLADEGLLCGLVQRRAPAQRNPLRDSRPKALRAGDGDPRAAQLALRARPPDESRAVVSLDEELDAHRPGRPQSRTNDPRCMTTFGDNYLDAHRPSRFPGMAGTRSVWD
jgi:Homeodomain-like domain